MAMETLREKVTVLCYTNGSIKYGPDGVYYEGSTPKKIRVRGKTELSTLLNALYPIFGLDKQRSKIEIFGRLPFVVSPHLSMYAHFPVVNDSSLETMLEVPSNHPSIKDVELYLEVRSTSNGVNDPAACSSPSESPVSSLKRQRTQQPQVAPGSVTHPPSVKLERDNGLEVQGLDTTNGCADAAFRNGSTHHGDEDREMTEANSSLDGVEQVVNWTANNVSALEASANACLDKGVESSASNPWSLSSLWVDDHELRVGLCFKDRDELKKVVDWCSIRGRQKCVVRETKKDAFTFECIRWKCKWTLWAARMEEHGLVEITKFTGPHTCRPIRPDNFDVEFAAEEIESLIRVQPTLTIAELKDWWFQKFGDMLETSEMQEAKQEVIKKVFGVWDRSFRVLPKLMAAFHLSNGLLVDWQYDIFPNPEFASFRGVLMTDSITHVIMPIEKGAFQVTEPLQNDEWIVRLNECTCTCGKFQSSKFPCLHALAVCEKLKINPLQYVDNCYTLDRLYKTYAATFSPVPEVSAWSEASGVPTLFPPVILPPPNNTVNDKTKEPPSDEELRNAVVDILKVVDLKTTAFADILKRLAEKFEIDLTPQKLSIKEMIQNELQTKQMRSGVSK